MLFIDNVLIRAKKISKNDWLKNEFLFQIF